VKMQVSIKVYCTKGKSAVVKVTKCGHMLLRDGKRFNKLMENLIWGSMQKLCF